MQRCLNPRKDGNNISVHLVDLLESHCSAEAIRSDFASEASNLNGIGGLADLNLRVARPQRHVGGGRSSPTFTIAPTRGGAGQLTGHWPIS